MKMRSIGVLAWLALFATACSTIHYSQLQGSYQTLRQREASFGGSTSALDRDELAAAFMAVAQDAHELAKDENDPVTKVAILRLSAVSAWRAQDRGGALALSASTEGRQACEGLSDETYGAPRDCALLLFVPNFVARDRLVASLPRTPASTSDPRANGAFVAKVGENANAINVLAEENVEGWAVIGSGTGAYQNLAPGVKDYIQAQVRADACWTFGLQDALGAIAAQDAANAEAAAGAVAQLEPAVAEYQAQFRREGC
jgi:hypothetical protein